MNGILRVTVCSTLIFVLITFCSMSSAPLYAAETVEAAFLQKIRPLPPSIELAVLHPPTAVRAEGKYHIIYELHATNLGKTPVTLSEVSVLVGQETSPPLVTYQADDFADMLKAFDGSTEPGKLGQIAPGMRVVVFVWANVNDEASVPDKVRNRVTLLTGVRPDTEPAIIETPAVPVTRSAAPSILPPVAGEGWLAAEAPVNLKDWSHHRFGLIALAGQTTISQRYAVDWMKFGSNGKLFDGDPSRNESWYGYGKEIRAVLDGKVLEAKDGIPDNVPLTSVRAVPMGLNTLAGNYVLVEHEAGVCGLYAHMIPGSVKVKVGDTVQRGQALGLLGNSGNSDAPHLHFHVSTKPSGEALGAEGLPYKFKSFQLVGRLPLPLEGVEGLEDLGKIKWSRNAFTPRTRNNDMPLGYRVYTLPK